MLRKALLLTTAVLGLASLAPLQAQQLAQSQDWCREQRWNNDRYGVCEVRQYTLMAGAGALSIDAAPNGGIQVTGGPRGDVFIEARVVATADNEARAKEIASGVRIDAVSDKVTADGPSGLGRQESWHVSYRVAVPTQTSLQLKSSNGGISVADVEGRIEARTVNGGVKFTNLAGEVMGRTSNGGVEVDLNGSTWVGAGLDVETSNGGVRIRIPEQYSARLEAGTLNGGFDIDFPLTVQGKVDREIAANIGAGGPLIRVRTHNGGLKVSKK
jgi:putative adhesin